MLHAALMWKWPGAKCVVRGGTLERWDGPQVQPTDAEIAQALTDYRAQNIAVTEERDRQIDQKLMIALATAVHKRFKLLPGDTMTAAQWKALIRAEWDALP